jgi:hypothetical protein
MILASISDIIRLVTSSTADIHVQAGWVDITTTTFTPGRTNTLVTTATNTTIVDSPAASTQRQIKTLTIANRHASAPNTISVQLYDGTIYITVFNIILVAGEQIQYNGSTWASYDVNGNIQESTGIAAVGADTQIMFNDGGTTLGVDTDITWDKATNTLGITGTNAGVKLQAISSEPGAQASGLLRIYAKSVAGKIMLKQVGPTGLDTPLQNAIWQNNTVLFTPGAAAGVWQGTVGSNIGTPTIQLPTMTNVGTMLRRSRFPTVATTANQQVGTRTEAMFARGNIAGLGGFFFVCRFNMGVYTAATRWLIGLAAGTTAVTTVEPSTLVNVCAFTVDAADNVFVFSHNDTTGTATKDAIAGQPALATNNAYAAYIFCKPNDTTVYYRLDNLNNGTTIIDSSATTDLPINTTFLCAHAACGNAATTAAGSASIDINRVYIETDI